MLTDRMPPGHRVPKYVHHRWRRWHEHLAPANYVSHRIRALCHLWSRIDHADDDKSNRISDTPNQRSACTRSASSFPHSPIAIERTVAHCDPTWMRTITEVNWKTVFMSNATLTCKSTKYKYLFKSSWYRLIDILHNSSCSSCVLNRAGCSPWMPSTWRSSNVNAKPCKEYQPLNRSPFAENKSNILPYWVVDLSSGRCLAPLTGIWCHRWLHDMSESSVCRFRFHCCCFHWPKFGWTILCIAFSVMLAICNVGQFFCSISGADNFTRKVFGACHQSWTLLPRPNQRKKQK